MEPSAPSSSRGGFQKPAKTHEDCHLFAAAGLSLLPQSHRAGIQDSEIQRGKSKESPEGKAKSWPWQSTGGRGSLRVLG